MADLLVGNFLSPFYFFAPLDCPFTYLSFVFRSSTTVILDSELIRASSPTRWSLIFDLEFYFTLKPFPLNPIGVAVFSG